MLGRLVRESMWLSRARTISDRGNRPSGRSILVRGIYSRNSKQVTVAGVELATSREYSKKWSLRGGARVSHGKSLRK